MSNFDKNVYVKTVRAVGSKVYLGRGEQGRRSISSLNNESFKNRQNAEEECLDIAKKYFYSCANKGELKLFSSLGSESFSRYNLIHNADSTSKVREMLGYTKKTFTANFTNYLIKTVEKTEERGTGEYKFDTNYDGYVTGLHEEKKEQKYLEYYSQEQVCAVVIEVYMKIVKEDYLEEVEKKEAEFIEEHDYLLSRKKKISSEGVSSKVYTSLIPFTISLLMAFLCLITSCFTLGGGEQFEWNLFRIDRDFVELFPFIKTIFEPYAIIWTLIFFLLFLGTGIFAILKLKALKNVQGGKGALTKKRKMMLIVFWIVLSVVSIVALTTFIFEINVEGINDDILYVLAFLARLIGRMFDGLFIDGLQFRLIFIFVCLIGFIFYLIGCCTGFFGAVKNIDRLTKRYNNEIQKREESGRFEELEKIRRRIVSLNVK